MTGPENFLERWSRRKLTKADPAAAEEQAAGDGQQAESTDPTSDVQPETELFDPASLPPIETIDAKTDVTAFLRPGVPPDLTRAALRRAWTSDPAIRDFVGLAENSWDFNDPQAMHGFGAIDPADAARLFAQAVGQVLAPPTETKNQAPQKDPQIGSDAEAALADEGATGDDVHRIANDAAQKESDS